MDYGILAAQGFLLSSLSSCSTPSILVFPNKYKMVKWITALIITNKRKCTVKYNTEVR